MRTPRTRRPDPDGRTAVNASPAPPGFTLIELLEVIAIIALLMAILPPEKG